MKLLTADTMMLLVLSSSLACGLTMFVSVSHPSIYPHLGLTRAVTGEVDHDGLGQGPLSPPEDVGWVIYHINHPPSSPPSIPLGNSYLGSRLMRAVFSQSQPFPVVCSLDGQRGRDGRAWLPLSWVCRVVRFSASSSTSSPFASG